MIRCITIMLLLLAAVVGTARAQRGDTLRTDSAHLKPSAPTAADTAKARGDTSAPAYVMTKSPLKATLYSIIPGGGQIYNQQYFKAGLFIAGVGFFVGRAVYLNSRFLNRADSAAQYTIGSSTYEFYKSQREAYRDARDENIAYGVGVWILGMIDAYVGAHLFDFDVSDDKTSRIYLTPERPGIGLAMRW